MSGVRLCIGVAALLSLGACAVQPPSGPSIAAMPGNGKSYEAFQADDSACRYAAYNQSGGAQAAQAGTNAAVGSAAVGTVVGAAAGALLGAAAGNAGIGAAAGAGAGLLTGSAVGANGAQYSAADLQRNYDTVYGQCMFAHGDTIQRPVVVAPYPAYYYGPRAYYPYAY